MDVVYERCCGLAIHKRTVVACCLTPGPAGRPQKEVRTFGTMTANLVSLVDWLASAGVTQVAMESTGVYWQPVWNLLEDRFALILANARHSKAVPGRKTDVKDAEWIADLLGHGLIQDSLVPDRRQRELRELTRSRSSLAAKRTAELNRLQKTREGANIKLTSIASDVQGKSAREMREQLVAGTTHAGARRTWRVAGCGRSCPSWSGRWRERSAHTIASWSPSNWRIWTRWTRRSARAVPNCRRACTLLNRRQSRGWMRFPASGRAARRCWWPRWAPA